MRGRITAGLLAILVLIGAWYIASPLWTLHELREAARAGDAKAFASYVDFPVLRENVKTQLRHQLADRIHSRGGIAALGAILVGGIVDDSIDRLVSPDALRIILEKMQPGGGPLGFSVSDASVRRDGVSQFRLVAKTERGSGRTLVFTRHGLGWKLSDIVLSADSDGDSN